MLLLIVQGLFGQAYIEEIKAFQAEQNEKFSSEEKSPLTKKDRKKFVELPFYEIDSSYKILANLTLTPDSDTFEMATTTERKPLYQKFGIATFTIEGDTHQLSVYQNLRLKEKPKYQDYLFLPFADNTNGESSYGGGRFIDLRIPKSDSISIDFNKSYNPYCAYNHKYSCPIPPKENRLSIPIRAGVKAPEKH
jgi:uncharacterized protein (DUF1684 family)